jgi:signal peptidase I
LEDHSDLRFVASVALCLVVAGWAFLLRPPFLGGDTSSVIVSGASMEPAVHAGDLVVVRRQGAYHVGDVVAYRVPVPGPFKGAKVFHRISGGSPEAGFVMKGDNRADADLWRPRPGDMVGRAWLRLPGAGRLLLRLRSPLVMALLAGGVAVYLTLTWSPRRPREPLAA